MESSTSPKQPTGDHEKLNLLLNYVLLFLTCAFIGWLWEVLLSLIKSGTFVNRGVLHGPWLPIYGFGGVFMALFLQHFAKYPPAVFGMSVLICGILEYGTGWYLETFKHLKWWDYSDLIFNLDGRVCLLSLTCFGVAGLFMIYLLKPNLFRLYDHIPMKLKTFLCIIFVICITGDAIYAGEHPNTGEGITNSLHTASSNSN